MFLFLKRSYMPCLGVHSSVILNNSVRIQVLHSKGLYAPGWFFGMPTVSSSRQPGQVATKLVLPYSPQLPRVSIQFKLLHCDSSAISQLMPAKCDLAAMSALLDFHGFPWLHAANRFTKNQLHHTQSMKVLIHSTIIHLQVCIAL